MPLGQKHALLVGQVKSAWLQEGKDVKGLLEIAKAETGMEYEGEVWTTGELAG